MSEDHHSESFGFRTVPEGDKQRLVGEVFASVAGRYDLMNDLMSMGVHRLWKDALADAARPRPGQHLLDVAGGTGDIAFRLARRGARVTVCDINPAMLAEGVKRAEAKGLGLDWVCANAESLPFPDGGFDGYTIAFGIRNVTHIDRALAEAHRVLKPGGRFLCLEFSHVEMPGLDALYDRYSFSVLPALGHIVANDADSYRYLAESIRQFPPQEAFAAMIRHAGFARTTFRNLSFGIAALHSAWKI